MKEVTRALEDYYVREVFTLARGEVYLVGGFIRDCLLDRESYDRDFAIKGYDRDLILRVRQKFNGTIVTLKGTTRIALKNKVTLDFTHFQNQISEDLLRRDFTINAMALSKDRTLFDPCGGIEDLKAKVIRMVREDNLINDPLRMLRAFRFRSELGFGIENRTIEFIKANANLVATVAEERLTFEFLKLVEGQEVETALTEAYRTGVLNQIFLLKQKGSGEMLKVLSNCLERLKVSHHLFTYSPPPKDISPKALLILEVLLFYSGQDRLLLPASLRRRIKRFIKGQQSGCLHDRHYDLYECFSLYGDALPEGLVFTGRMDLEEVMKRYFETKKTPLIKGRDLLEAGLPQGPAFKKVLQQLHKAQFLGLIKDKREALNLVFNEIKES